MIQALLSQLVMFIVNLVCVLTPGAGCVAVILWARSMQQSQRMSKPRIGLIVFAVFAAGCLCYKRIAAPGGGGIPRVLAAGGDLQDSSSGAVPGNSGEEVMTNSGRFVLKPFGRQATEEWQSHLSLEMTAAIRRGREQVVLMFTRQGCPWCEKQIGALHRAMARRGQGGGNKGLAMAPLRVFILDASDFAQLTQQFGVEGFPTSLVFGQPGVPPRIVQGFQDDAQLEQVLAGVANESPQQVQANPQKRKAAPKKRRGLFR